MRAQTTYWFPAKRYGWGWGPPTCWQGWAVVVAFVVLIATGSFVFLSWRDTLDYALYVTALSAVLIAICWLKGEPPEWRWGDRD